MNEKTVVTCPQCSHKMNVPVGKHIRFTCPKCNKQLEYGKVSIGEETRESPREEEKEAFVQQETSAQEDIEEIEDSPSVISSILLLGLGIIASIPAFILLHKNIPNLHWVMGADRILLYASTLLLIYILLRQVRGLVYFVTLIAALWLTYGSIWGDYGFKSIYRDYQVMLCKMKSDPIPVYIDKTKIGTFEDSNLIEEATDTKVEELKVFANKLACKSKRYYRNSPEYKDIIQCFSVYREITESWKEIKDPEDRILYANAGQTIETLSGDKEDYAIFVATCIKAVGGKVRIVKTENSIYPEIMVGQKEDIDKIHDIVVKKMFKSEAYGKRFYYHVEENGVWLKMDREVRYPGSNIEDEVVKSILFL